MKLLKWVCNLTSNPEKELRVQGRQLADEYGDLERSNQLLRFIIDECELPNVDLNPNSRYNVTKLK